MTGFARTPDPLPPSQFFDLRGRTALVVGAGRPLGLAIAAALAEAGADVAVAGLTHDDLEMAQVNSAANLVWSLGRRNLVLPMDATDPASVEACVQQVDDAWGRIDILVNAQDLLFAMPFDETGRDEWDAVIAANLTSVALTCQAVGRVMLRQGYGRVINLTSMLGERGIANLAAYAAANGGVLALTRALSQEWATRGLTVNAIQIGHYEDQAGIGDNPQYAAELAKMLPSRALVKSDDAAALVLVLASDSGYTTGSVIPLDGGATQRI